MISYSEVYRPQRVLLLLLTLPPTLKPKLILSLNLILSVGSEECLLLPCLLVPSASLRHSHDLNRGGGEA